MNSNKFALIAIGNILQKDDGLAIFAAQYLEKNYTFHPELEIIQGGVEGMNLLNTFAEYDEILFLDALQANEEAGSIFYMPIEALPASPLAQSSAHEVGLIECLGMLELMDEKIPSANLLAMVVDDVSMDISLSPKLVQNFDLYIESALKSLKSKGFEVKSLENQTTLEEIIRSFKE